jgi:hypothetical protein
MHRSLMVRRLSWFSCLAFCGALLLSGCGDDMSEPKSEIPKETPKDLAKDSQQFFIQQNLTKKGTAKTKR